MVQFADLPSYDRLYFETYQGGPYERNSRWLTMFGALADAIVRDFRPQTVLDVGCAKGFLVEALRDRGVEAYGRDVSEYAIDSARSDVRAYCELASIMDPPQRRYDLVVCMEVVEHLPAEQAETAVANLCAAADDVFFSSTPDAFEQRTHLNVQPPEYWASLFARAGFLRDLEFDVSSPFPAWSGRFRRSSEPIHRALAGYERRLWSLWRENLGLKQQALASLGQLQRLDQALRARPSETQLERTAEEQQAQIDALNERLVFMSDIEQNLRVLLLDTHEQLLKRDQIIAGQNPAGTVQELQGLVQERSAYAEQLQREVEARDARIDALHQQLDAMTMSAAVSEERRETVLRLQALVDERTGVAARAVADTAAQAQALQAVFQSSSWKMTAPLRLLRLRQRLGR